MGSTGQKQQTGPVAVAAEALANCVRLPSRGVQDDVAVVPGLLIYTSLSVSSGELSADLISGAAPEVRSVRHCDPRATAPPKFA
jgi:hypothetical protein